MNLIDDAAQVLRRAWSIRLALLSAVFSFAEAVLPFFTDFVPPRLMAGLAVFTAIGATIARLVAQPKSLP